MNRRRARDGGPDDPAARERAREALHRELDRGAEPGAAARAALRVSDECVEAWLVLVDSETTDREAAAHLRKAVAVATTVLGRDGLREGRGRLADTPDGVAYLHALGAMAGAQSTGGRVAQAIQTLQHVLEMDPRDPTAVHATLLLLLLATGRDDEAEDVVAAYPEAPSAPWMFARALLRLRRATDDESLTRADAALDRALARFPDEGRALAEGRPSPVLDPALRLAFDDTDGAIAWLRSRLEAAVAPAPRSAPDADADRRFSAREHVAEAADAPSDRREALLRRAADEWPDCVEAWRGLAALASDATERIALGREAVAAARRVLGEGPDRRVGPVGEGEDARALLAARDDLARSLREVGRPLDALEQESLLLEEDPADSRGVGLRHLVHLWKERSAEFDREADALLASRAADASPGWTWARVLDARRRGATRREPVPASFALAEATMTAPLVGPLLLAGGTRVPRPEGLSQDSFDACTRAADVLRPAWESTPGALAWLASMLPSPPPRSRTRPGTSSP